MQLGVRVRMHYIPREAVRLSVSDLRIEESLSFIVYSSRPFILNPVSDEITLRETSIVNWR
jgi:hypothetical protein